MIRIGQSDLEVMGLLAELRLATAEQLAAATGGSAEAMARRMRQLSVENGYVQMRVQDLGQGPGRPRNLFALARPGAESLAQAGRLTTEQLAAVVELPAHGTHRHLIMANTVWAQLRGIPRRVPFLEAPYLASYSPLTERTPDGKSVLLDQVSMEDGRLIGFEPDGAFCLRHLELNMALLFLVEADRGTEPRSTQDERAAINRKLACYRRYFALEGYRRYEKRWGCTFNGFRLLVIAETPQRAQAVCRLVLESPPSQFVWVTESGKLLTQGVHAPIWTVGGDTQLAAQSILGGQYERVRNLLDSGSRDLLPPVSQNVSSGH